LFFCHCLIFRHPASCCKLLDSLLMVIVFNMIAFVLEVICPPYREGKGCSNTYVLMF